MVENHLKFLTQIEIGSALIFSLVLLMVFCDYSLKPSQSSSFPRKNRETKEDL